MTSNAVGDENTTSELVKRNIILSHCCNNEKGEWIAKYKLFQKKNIN